MTQAATRLSQHPRIILFDGVCNFCNSSVQLILKNDSKQHFTFASLQSEAGQTLLNHFNLPDTEFDSIIYIEHHCVYEKSSAALRIARCMDWPWKLILIGMVIPRFLRDLLYSWVAKNRYRWFGQKDQCMIPSPAQRARFIG